MAERFVEVRARFGNLEEALKWAHEMDDNGVSYVKIDNGVGLGLQECSILACDAVLAYPDEGETCSDHEWMAS